MNTEQIAPEKAYRIAYRSGGTENFTWCCILDKYAGEALRAYRESIERMGYPTVALADGEPLPDAYHVPGWDDKRFRRIHAE